MSAVTADQIRTQILAGSYTNNYLNADNVFTKPQYQTRRRYPSCEVIITTPQGTEETLDKTSRIYGFEVRLYTKNIGDQSDELTTQTATESTIITQIESLTLQDHRITFESKLWSREQFQRDGAHPAYTVSVLKVQVRQVTSATLPQTGTLTFIVASSSVDNPPAGNYSFAAYNVDSSEGYTGVDENVTTSPRGFGVPIHYTGHFRGKFICDIVVAATDIGSTGEKLNKIMTLRSTGEKPEMVYTYTEKTNTTSPSTITETVKLELDTLQRRYITGQNVIYRVIADIIEPSTITVT
jgi:hypothetical protein